MNLFSCLFMGNSLRDITQIRAYKNASPPDSGQGCTMLFKFLVSLATLLVHHKEPVVNGPLDIPTTTPSQAEHEFIPYPDGPQTPEEEARAAKALHGMHYGGDMILPDAYNQSGAGLRDDRFRWPGYPGSGVIPFVIDDSLADQRDLIYRAMAYYHRTTCIQFRERTNERDFVRLYRGNGCWSRIGRNGGMQDLSLGDDCHFFGLVVHELGHAVGLVHEHQRSDRNNWIWVYRQNVQAGQEDNFSLTSNQHVVLWTQYDYNSIMHYGNYAFSRVPNRLMTMEAKNGQQLLEPFQKQGFTNGDIFNIRKLYQC